MVAGFVSSSDERRSLLSVHISILCKLLKVTSFEKCVGVCGKFRVVVMTLWSLRKPADLMLEGRISSLSVMSKSSVCPWLWVGKSMCCCRFQDLRRSLKELALEVAVSMWILKSPEIMLGVGEAVNVSSRLLNSCMSHRGRPARPARPAGQLIGQLRPASYGRPMGPVNHDILRVL